HTSSIDSVSYEGNGESMCGFVIFRLFSAVCITHEYPWEQLPQAIEMASQVDEALNVVIGLKLPGEILQRQNRQNQRQHRQRQIGSLYAVQQRIGGQKAEHGKYRIQSHKNDLCPHICHQFFFMKH